MPGQDADLAETHFKQGEELVKAEQFEEATKEFKEAIRLKPDWAEANFKLGQAYSMRFATDEDKFEAAFAAFKEAARLKPDWPEAHYEVGARHLGLRQYEQATQSLGKAVRLKPDFTEAHKSLGVVYLYTDRWAEAVESFKTAVKLKPDWAMAHKLLGMAYVGLEERGKAQEQYEILKPLDREMADYLYAVIGQPGKPVFGVEIGKALSKPPPAYPEVARKAKVSGAVKVQITVDEDGSVIYARAFSGPPDLRLAAEEAALKARFQPTKLSGHPVKVSGTITYNFILH